MRCYICNVILSVNEIQLDSKQQTYPCKTCCKVSANTLTELESVTEVMDAMTKEKYDE